MKWRINSKIEKTNTINSLSSKKEYGESDGLQGAVLCPLQEINGYLVRPGFYRMKGAFETKNGVSFTCARHTEDSHVTVRVDI